MVPAPHAPVAVRGDEDDRIDSGRSDDVEDGVRSQLGEAPKAAFLPRRDNRGNGLFVRDRSPSGGEREPPARALPAARHRPRRRRAAAGAVRAEEERQRRPAAGAEILTQPGAGNAATREEQVEDHMPRR